MPGLLYIKTFGCQMNEYDSGKMRDVLEAAHGMKSTDNPAEADVLLVNTCSVREKAQEKVFSLLGEWRLLKQQRPHVVIGVGGCVASQEGEGITARAPFVDLVFGPQTLHRLPAMIQGLKESGPIANRHQFSGNREIRSPAGGALQRRHRLRFHHGGLQQVLHVLRRALHARRGNQPPVRSGVGGGCNTWRCQGVREITLLGQNVNAYAGPMADGTLADLSTLIHFVAAIDGIERIRFTTSHPLEFNDSLIEAYAQRPATQQLPASAGAKRLGPHSRRHEARTYRARVQAEAAQAARGAAGHLHIDRLDRRLSRRNGAGFSGDHEFGRGSGLRSVLQLSLQPQARHAGRGIAGRGAA